MRYQAVVFDFDYTLGDATEAIFTGFTHAFSSMGLPAPEREAVRGTVGMLVTDAYTLLSGDGSEAGRKTFFSYFHPMARSLQARGVVDLFPGAVELLEGLKGAGVPVGVVSTKNTDTLRDVFAAKGIAHLISAVIGGDLVARPKPDPEGLLRQMGEWGLDKAALLYCGDTTIDAETAQRAGVDFCAVLNGTTPAEAFAGYPKVHESPELWDLKDWLEV